MDSAFIIVNTLLLLIAILVSVYLVRAVVKIFKAKKHLEQKNSSKVGFVVDTFHDLVSKLKEKEQELEALRQKAEDRATEIEDYNENILQSVPSGVISFDRDMKITKVNSSAEKILEIDERSAINKHYTEILKEPIIALLADQKNIERGEISYLTPSGKKIWLGLTLSPLKNTEGEVIGQILVFTDLTHLKAFESQMALRDKFSSLGEISAGIAHELRNPMGVIAGYTKLLTRKINPPLKPTVDAIAKEIMVMDRIISDFLSFAKLTEPDISRVDLKKLIVNCLTAVTGNRKDIALHLNISGLPLLNADEVLLRQAFTNLLQNSVEAMPQGGELTVQSEIKDAIGLTISDTGHGISENVLDKIFLPFYTTKEKGTGLGLAIVHKIIASHGGTTTVKSSDKGTIFKIVFPIEMIAGEQKAP